MRFLSNYHEVISRLIFWADRDVFVKKVSKIVEKVGEKVALMT
jgi:hypothetical protein